MCIIREQSQKIILPGLKLFYGPSPLGGFLLYKFLAVHTKGTIAAFGVSGGAGISAEQHDPMAEIGAFLRGEDFAKLLLYLFRLLALSKTQTVGNADAVRIADHTAGRGIKITQQQIGGFSADTGQPQKGVHSIGHFSTVVTDQHLAGKDNVLGLMVVEAAGADIVFHILDFCICHSL